MDSANGTEQFVLSQLSNRTWAIEDEGPSARVVAEITLTDEDDVTVIWVDGTPLPTRYRTPQDVLADLKFWKQRPRGGTKPIPIPHLSPPNDAGKAQAVSEAAVSSTGESAPQD